VGVEAEIGTMIQGRPDSTVSRLTRLLGGQQQNGGSIPGTFKRFFSSP
jgi:hypothetical protein